VVFAALTELPNWGIQSTVLFLERQFLKINYQPAEQGFRKPEPAPRRRKGGRTKGGNQGSKRASRKSAFSHGKKAAVFELFRFCLKPTVYMAAPS